MDVKVIYKTIFFDRIRILLNGFKVFLCFLKTGSFRTFLSLKHSSIFTMAIIINIDIINAIL